MLSPCLEQIDKPTTSISLLFCLKISAHRQVIHTDGNISLHLQLRSISSLNTQVKHFRHCFYVNLGSKEMLYLESLTRSSFLRTYAVFKLNFMIIISWQHLFLSNCIFYCLGSIFAQVQKQHLLIPKCRSGII